MSNTYHLQFLQDLYHSRSLLWELTKTDLKKRYLGSYLGVIWAFVQPTVTVMVTWVVFSVGFKSKPVEDVPFILWLVCGMFPWFFFGNAVTSATSSITSNSFLVTKVVFRVSLLPLIQILSELIVHLFLLALMFAMFAFYGLMPRLCSLQLFYYLACELFLIFGISLITSSLSVFSRDVNHLVRVIIQLGYWVTPIFWNLDMMPSGYRWIFELNPMCYVANGYRDALIHGQWLWQHAWQTAVFWTLAIGFILLGITLFKKLKPHFADVL